MAKLIHAGEFATESEKRTAYHLKDNLPAKWVIITNKVLPTQNGNSYEIDFIVIGDHQVFVLDDKAWFGELRGDDQYWILNGESRRSPLNTLDMAAKVLRGRIESKVPSVRNQNSFYVYPGVILPSQGVSVNLSDSRSRDHIFRSDTVCHQLRRLDADTPRGNELVGFHCAEIEKCLVDLERRAQTPRLIGEYRIEEVIAQRPGMRLFRATIEEVGVSRPRLLYVYDLGNPAERGDSEEFYRRECEALRKLRNTGLCPEFSDPFRWSDNFLVLPVTPPDGKSLSDEPTPQRHSELLQELALAEVALRGLAKMHQEGVIHRAIAPDALYVTTKGASPKIVFTNFYAARLGGASIAVNLDQLRLTDPYAAPELAGSYGGAQAASDTWSLALVFFERLSGRSITELSIDAKNGAIPRLEDRWTDEEPKILSEITSIFQSALAVDPCVRFSPSEVADFLSDQIKLLRAESATKSDAGEKPLLNGRYKALRVVGRGTTVITYLAYDEVTGANIALQKFIRPEEAFEMVRKEWAALENLTSPYIARIRYVFSAKDDVQIAMDYIPGPTLEALANEFPWPLDRWRSLAHGLIEGVAALEGQGIRHRDIKPANIILHTADDRPVLVDFGFAVRYNEASPAAGTPRYWPPEASGAATPPESCDRYALAVVLYQTLIGSLPAPQDSIEDDMGYLQMERPELSQEDEKTIRECLSVLRDAFDPNPQKRPNSIQEFRQRLEAAMRPPVEETLALLAPVPLEAQSVETHDDAKQGGALSERINPWIDDIRSLYRNSAIGNANNRGLDTDFVRETYVPTRLDTAVLPNIIKRRPKALFLSGNPGDGKTAFLEQVRAALIAQGAETVEADASGWEFRLNGHTFRSCYDASESHEGMSADEQLERRLGGLEGRTEQGVSLTTLVAINDGRLADFFTRKKATFGWLAQYVLAKPDPRRSTTINGVEQLFEKPVWVIDLKRRAFVRLPGANGANGTHSLLLATLDKLVDRTQWNICESCSARDVCPLRRNAMALREAASQERLDYLFTLIHLRRQRHITMRDLRSALAYTLTADHGCADVHRAVKDGDLNSLRALRDLAFWRAVFSDVTGADDLLAEFARLDPARFPQPRLDRFLHFHQDDADSMDRAMLFRDRTDMPKRTLYESEGEWLGAMKRRLYFESVGPEENANAPTWRELAPYRYSNEYFALLAGGGNKQEALRRLAVGMLRSEGVNIRPRAGFGIKVNASEEQQLVILKEFPLDRFSLKPGDSNGHIETIPETLILTHWRDNQPYYRLELTLDHFELLMRMADGLLNTAPEFQPLLEDLQPFKHALLLSEANDITLVERQTKVSLFTQRDNKIVLRADQGAL